VNIARAIIVVVLSLGLGGPGVARADHLVLVAALSMQSSGLLAQILPKFTAATGIEVTAMAKGAEQALASAARGEADLLLVHDPQAEAAFVAAGHGLPPREIAWNDLLLVGPKSDPAHIGGTRNAARALKAIADTGVSFVTRGDHSGTDAQEHRLWSRAGVDPSGQAWYHTIPGGSEAVLDAAVAMQAVILTDRSTWLALKHQGNLVALVQGDRDFINRYDVIELNPTRHAQANLAAAHVLAQWLAGPAGQQAIGAVMIDGEQAFHPDADAPYPR